MVWSGVVWFIWIFEILSLSGPDLGNTVLVQQLHDFGVGRVWRW